MHLRVFRLPKTAGLSFLYHFFKCIVCGVLIGAFGLAMGCLAYSTLDPLFGVNVAQAVLGAALIGGAGGAIWGSVLDSPLRKFIENVTSAVF